ncbi:MAG: hypothetical protein ACE5I5_14380 [Candidatus Heimdallarchaeota archaeon]
MSDKESPFDWKPLVLPPQVMAGLRTKSILCVGLITFHKTWGPLASIADIRPKSKTSELLKDPARRSEVYEGLAYTGLEFQGIGDERIVVARNERREFPEFLTDLLLFAVDEKSIPKGETLYGILTLAKMVMSRSEGQVEMLPKILYDTLIPKKAEIEELEEIEGFRRIRAPIMPIEELAPLLGLIFVDLKNKKFIRQFFPDFLSGHDTGEMELFLFRLVTRQPEPPFGFPSAKPESLPWGFHIQTEWKGYHFTTLYSTSFGSALVALSSEKLSWNLLVWFNVLLSLLDVLGLNLHGETLKEVLIHVLSVQHSEPKRERAHYFLELMLRSHELVPLFPNEQLRSEVEKFPNRYFFHQYPIADLINELGNKTIYSLSETIGIPLNEVVTMIMFLQSREFVKLQRVGS